MLPNKLSEFLTITKKDNYILELQFSDNDEFIKYLKSKIPLKYMRFVCKEMHKDKIYREELRRNIWYYEIHRKYWKRMHSMLPYYFRKIYIIKNGKTYIVKDNKAVNLKKTMITIKDENIYEKDYLKKKYKVYRDR